MAAGRASRLAGGPDPTVALNLAGRVHMVAAGTRQGRWGQIMFRSIVRVLAGFVAACLVAGAIQVLFALTPAALIAGSSEQLSRATEWMLLAATHSAVFSAPFALVAAAIGEWRSIRSWTYYALVGLAIAVAGFTAQYQAEVAGQPSVANNYALTAFLTTGFVGGFAYWLTSGRRAGDPIAPQQTRTA